MQLDIALAARPADSVSGPVLPITGPLSFWGGVDPKTSAIVNPRLPQHGLRIAGTILLIRELVGSSSSSSILLELIKRGIAPAAIVIPAMDAILILGCLVGQEMGWPTPPIAVLAAPHQAELAEGAMMRLDTAGVLSAMR